MKVLTLKQPWASLVVDRFPGKDHPPKGWETRSWKPSLPMAHIMRTDGFLIHCSAKPADIVTRCRWPFLSYYFANAPLPQGCIIGFVRLGRVITTHDWVREYHRSSRSTDPPEEYHMGDYSAGRWAWELVDAVKFKTPIPAKGSLSLWNYNPQSNIFTQ